MPKSAQPGCASHRKIDQEMRQFRARSCMDIMCGWAFYSDNDRRLIFCQNSPRNGLAIVDALLERNKAKMGLVPVSLAVADYDRTRPLIDGRVIPEGIALQANTAWIGDFCLRPVYEEYDAAEMSLSWYVMARMRGARGRAAGVSAAHAGSGLCVCTSGRAVYCAKGSRRQENRDDAVPHHGQLVAAWDLCRALWPAPQRPKLGRHQQRGRRWLCPSARDQRIEIDGCNARGAFGAG